MVRVKATPKKIEPTDNSIRVGRDKKAQSEPKSVLNLATVNNEAAGPVAGPSRAAPPANTQPPSALESRSTKNVNPRHPAKNTNNLFKKNTRVRKPNGS